MKVFKNIHSTILEIMNFCVSTIISLNQMQYSHSMKRQPVYIVKSTFYKIDR